MDHDDGHFGEEVAARYDSDVEEDREFDPAVIRSTVDFLADLAGDGRALEFAIGTGRIGLPLAQRGVPVVGLELSRAMVSRLRAKPGGADIPVTIGDMSAARVEGSFRLVYLVFNTISNLTSQAAQVACFRNAAAHLELGGCFVIELSIPDLQWLPPGETFRLFSFSERHVGIDEFDVANQGLISHHFTREGDSDMWRLSSGPFRYLWPAELDLMADMAGLKLRERWADWDRSPFTGESRKHISVWEKPTQ
jgi:hypothetical protein